VSHEVLATEPSGIVRVVPSELSNEQLKTDAAVVPMVTLKSSEKAYACPTEVITTWTICTEKVAVE
jgi:hypothetical protein